MISKKLRIIFVASIPVFIAHGLEEYFTGFYNVDGIFKFVFQPFESMTIPQATFLLFQIMIWLLLIVSALLITNSKWQLRLMIIPGLIYIFEFHHIWKALTSGSYYPGVITAISFPILAFLFWKQLLKEFAAE